MYLFSPMRSFGLWLGDLLGGMLILWLSRLFLWKTFIKNNPEMEDAPQP